MLLPKKTPLVDPSILRASDIRGIVGKTLTLNTAEFIGKAFGTCLVGADQKQVCVAFDGRESSKPMADRLIAGLLSCGLKVICLGCVPTPVLYFALQVSGVTSGVMVTGSHNPKEYNGFKLVFDNKPFFEDQIKNLGHIANTGQFVNSVGSVEDADFSELYIHRILKDFRYGIDLTVVWDCGNGATGKIVQEIVQSLPGRHILLNAEIDGTFPNHHPDPSLLCNMTQLRDVVLLEHADFGVAFDGDGDRLGVVDGTGRVLFGDELLQIFAQDVLRLNPNALIMADIKASKTFSSEITAMNGRPLLWKTGHSFIKHKMLENKALLAGEMSGHFFFADKYYGYDDAIYAAIRLLEIASNGYHETLSQRVARIPETFCSPEIQIPVSDARKFKIIEQIKKDLKQKSEKFIDIDGIKVVKPEGWWLLRASNTQPMLVGRCEADTLPQLAHICQEMKTHLERYQLKEV